MASPSKLTCGGRGTCNVSDLLYLRSYHLLSEFDESPNDVCDTSANGAPRVDPDRVEIDRRSQDRRVGCPRYERRTCWHRDRGVTRPLRATDAPRKPVPLSLSSRESASGSSAAREPCLSIGRLTSPPSRGFSSVSAPSASPVR